LTSRGGVPGATTEDRLVVGGLPTGSASAYLVF